MAVLRGDSFLVIIARQRGPKRIALSRSIGEMKTVKGRKYQKYGTGLEVVRLSGLINKMFNLNSLSLIMIQHIDGESFVLTFAILSTPKYNSIF